MKIECEQCAASDSIADAKIETTRFNVRCKRCQAYIVVRDAGAELSAASTAAPLTGQRNQDSVLFSLEDIAPPAAAAQARAPLRLLPPPAEDSTGSGLLDIREMQAKLATERRPAPKSDAPEEHSMPSFGGAGLGGLSAAPLLSPPPPPPAPTPLPPAPRRGLIYALLSSLSLGVLALAAHVALEDPEPKAVTVLEAAQVEREPEATLAAAAATEPRSDEPGEEERELGSPGATPEVQTRATIKPARNRNRNRNRDKVTQPSEPKPAKAPPKPDEVDVDCLLDMSLPKCGGKAKPPPPPSPAPTPAPREDNLPSKLGVTQINAGISPIKTAARACGSGTTVAVKFSVEGSSGRVRSAKPLDEHASSTVGTCVAKAAEGASFPRFASKQQGFTFKFRL